MHVTLPDELIHEIDDLVGIGGRSAFLAEIARREIQRRRFVQLLDRPGPGWKLEEHPELDAGAAAWVSQLRGDDERIDRDS
jgi:hypothetical protein